ncbi:recombinase family protein [Peribacillus frigoritolerans]|uniref:recombinase family protein n=1 Tax=Peribacillus frigoritolerans TaxID=450367 RepID=UPI002226553F|nr:recombinase family protein [Peribacillus frigoritolerans]UYY98715.1 recombinase family protein [Peribacillus frigoritolerans]
MDINIKEVAVYLRKSRDETDGKEDVLAKHESLLLEYISKNNLKYKIYKEIGSSEHINSRPEMLQLLKDVEQELYDAVLVVDLDRLIRGDLEDMGRLSRVFRDSNTVVITPTNKVYNFNDDDQSLINNFEMVFANYEYKMIKKRMLRGKKQGAKAGKWTNGTPPYPYVYNRITRELDIDSKKAKVYNLMKKMFIEDMKPAHEIAWELNKLGIKTSKNADWHENSIRRVLTSEVHLGLIIYGKTTGNSRKNKPNARGVQVKERTEWIVANGTHQPLKTEEEHQRILTIIESRRILPKGSRTNIQVLSKLLYCGKCKRARSFISKPNGKVYVQTCLMADRVGNRCKNRGMRVEIIYAQLMFDLEEYEQQLLNSEFQSKQDDNSTFQLVLKNKQEELNQLATGMDRLMDLYIEGSFDKEQLKAKTDKLQSRIQDKKDEIRSIERSIAAVNNERTDEDRLQAIKQFKEAWNTDDISRKELNTLAKEIIDRIELIRDGDKVQINIEFH